MDKVKKLYTTGEVAKICNLSQQTIIRCFDAGRVEGFRIPGSKFRRIPHESLIKFMQSNDIPIDALQSGKKKILIVDDDAEIIEMMVDVFVRDGRFDVRSAASGYEGGIMTEQFRPDLIILDYMLPDVNGNIVCRTIKRNPDFAEIKIIIVSGVVNEEEIEDLKQAGAEEFIKKPFNIAQLIDKITSILQIQ
jgi:CheY-like chemotaxis protein